MTVKNLIEKLEKMNPDAIVHLGDRNGEVLLFVMALANDNENVWFEGEEENDMANEIQTRFDYAIEHGEDELYVYLEMLEQGIDIEMVRKYLGDEKANHMETFCIEHGLI